MVCQSRTRSQKIVLGVKNMHELIVPTEVKISEIKANGSLSPNNYKKLTIKNKKQHTISFYLDEVPYQKGIEPGSSAYVPKSQQ